MARRFIAWGRHLSPASVQGWCRTTESINANASVMHRYHHAVTARCIWRIYDIYGDRMQQCATSSALAYVHTGTVTIGASLCRCIACHLQRMQLSMSNSPEHTWLLVSKSGPCNKCMQPLVCHVHAVAASVGTATQCLMWPVMHPARVLLISPQPQREWASLATRSCHLLFNNTAQATRNASRELATALHS